MLTEAFKDLTGRINGGIPGIYHRRVGRMFLELASDHHFTLSKLPALPELGDGSPWVSGG